MSSFKRVPGAKRYRAVSDGLRQVGMSSSMQQASMSAAQRIAGAAAADGRDDYRVVPRVLPAGWANENRGGAAVQSAGTASAHDAAVDGRNRVLRNALNRSITGGR